MTSVAIGLLSLGGDHRILFQMNILRSHGMSGVLIIISIASQIVLSLLGNVRKYNPRTRIKITLWCAYLLANTVASAALGIITQTALDVCSSKQSSPSGRLFFLFTLVVQTPLPPTL